MDRLRHRQYVPSIATLMLACLIIFVFGMAFATAPSAASAQEPAHVLVLHSYDPGYTWEQVLNEGIIAGLADAGYSEEAGTLVIDHFWMDTKRNFSADYLTRITQEATQAIRDAQPDVVIASDDNAVRLVVAAWEGEDIPFVFTGLNGKPEDYGLRQKPNVTGIIERVHIEETLAWIEFVMPEAKRITVLADDSFTTGTYASLIQMALDGSAAFHGSRMVVTNSFSEWQQTAMEAINDSDVLLIGTYSTLRDLSGNPMTQQVVMKWTIEISKVPVVPLWEFGVTDGALGGSVISSETQGYEAARMAASILGGTPPSEIPYYAPSRGLLALNIAAMERWNVSIPLSVLELSKAFGTDSQLLNR